MLYTMDEARGAIIESAAFVLHNVHAERTVLERLVRGERRGATKLRAHERAIVAAHRTLIHELAEAGYAWAVEDELEGICAAVFGGDQFQPAVLYEQVVQRLLDHPAA